MKNVGSITLACFLINGLLNSSAHSQQVQPVEKPVTGDDLQLWQYSLQQFRPKDQFDEPPKPTRFLGKKFSLTLPLKASGIHNSICTGEPFYGYDTSSHKLTIEYGDGETSATSEDTLFHPRARFTYDCLRKRATEMRQNAFGAKRSVDVASQFYDAIEAANIDGGVRGLLYEIELPGNAARQLVSALRLKVQGVLANENLFSCGRYDSKATLDDPSELHTRSCAYRARVSNIELVNVTTGQVYASLFHE